MTHYQLMKKSLLILLFFPIIITTQAKVAFSNFQIECITSDIEGYVTVKIWDLKKGIHYKIDQAKKDAIVAILFSGLEGKNRCTNQLPLLSDVEAQKRFYKIQKAFFSKKGKWIEFSRNAESGNYFQSFMPEIKEKVFQITISRRLLQVYLEENNIIPKLSKGI